MLPVVATPTAPAAATGLTQVPMVAAWVVEVVVEEEEESELGEAHGDGRRRGARVLHQTLRRWGGGGSKTALPVYRRHQKTEVATVLEGLCLGRSPAPSRHSSRRAPPATPKGLPPPESRVHPGQPELATRTRSGPCGAVGQHPTKLRADLHRRP